MKRLTDWAPGDGGPNIGIYAQPISHVIESMGAEEFAFVASGESADLKEVLVVTGKGLALFKCEGGMGDWKVDGGLIPWRDVRGVVLKAVARHPGPQIEWTLTVATPAFTATERWHPERVLEAARICLDQYARLGSPSPRGRSKR
jgi:hypothetical protein